MSTITSENLLSLVEIITTLPPEERAALSLLAVMYVPVSRATFAQCLSKAEIKSTQGDNMSSAIVTPLMEKFVAAKLAIDDSGTYRCNPLLSHFLTRQTQKDRLFKFYAHAVQEIIKPTTAFDYTSYRSYAHIVQDIRIALYLGNHSEVTRLLTHCDNYFFREFISKHPLLLVCPEPLDSEWIKEMPLSLQILIVTFHLEYSLVHLQPSDTSFKLLEELVSSQQDLSLKTLRLYATQMLMRGQLDKAALFLKNSHTPPLHEIHGCLAVLQGDNELAITHFENGLAAIKKESGKRKVFFADISGLFYLLALIYTGLPLLLQTAAELGELVVKQRSHKYLFVILMLSQYAEVKLGKNHSKTALIATCNSDCNSEPLLQLFHALIKDWMLGAAAKTPLKVLEQIRTGALKCGYFWLSAEAAFLSKRIHPQSMDMTAVGQQLFKAKGFVSISEKDDSGVNWEQSLMSLMSLGGTTPQTAKGGTANATRIIWLISGNETYVDIQPIEQKHGKSGWSTGRNIALKRLKEDGIKMDFLTAQDRAIVSCLKLNRSGYGYYSKEAYEFDTVLAIRAMAGHPLVFNARHRDEQITVVKGEFALEVKRVKGNLCITLKPSIDIDKTFFYRWEGTSRLLLFEPTADQRRIALIIGAKLNVPLVGESQVMAAITAVSPHVTINSDVAGNNAAAMIVEPDSRLQIMLRPNSGGLVLEIILLPLGEGGPRFQPGRGGATVIADVKGKKLQTSRKLASENANFTQLVNACPALELAEIRDGVWRFEDPESSLQLLEELQTVVAKQADCYSINWPEGESFKLRGKAEWSKMKLSVSSGKEWFSLNGEVAVSDDEVMSLQRLMELVDGESGRFIQLADGEFLALTDEFRRKLQDLRRLVEKNGRFTPLIAPLVEDTLQGAAGIKGDKQWKADMARFKTSQELVPIIPPTLQAELREYQREGFDWLCRLAQWGVGACLADDMGLGKTVQALALLLTRAAAGPALVLAPTSVCFNWENEARRFAPTLNPRIFGGGNRADFIASLAPFDLVICSYTLFQQEAELLTGIEWETAILDEAQAIKNMTTKRSQAAMQIKAGFRLATSGTPVENRLDELWNLFRFLNPGLLGSHTSFSTRFGIQIEKHDSKAARNLLKRLIRPFILRRLKSQVLEELPPRTDILHRIELSHEETAFYEALRRTAVEKLAGTENSPPGEKQIRILAEIMRLRRACCNPQLVMPGSNIPSAKLAAFHEIVAELRAGGHRALVFSQFVDHLSILRRDLDEAGISYQYLDGSTPQKERQGRVAAFQTGEGELFLISLKAGGVGLNLTAADYVIHMDPWWNPAVEDQASDRAHRIGQNRPVTVYRLVAANTIEEKIVALHHQKRDLADSLLEGTETSARVSAEDLMALLREVGD